MRKILTIILLVFPISIMSQIPQTINWQGIIQDANGNNLNGNYSITVKLFDVGTGGTSLWTETHTTVAITDGFANIVLGSVAPLDLPFDKQYWLEITVDNGTPMPRIQLASVPYALNMPNYTRVYDDGASEEYSEEQDEEGNFKKVLIRKDKKGKQRKKVVKKERFGDGEEREGEETEEVYDEDGNLLTRAFESVGESDDEYSENKFWEWYDRQQEEISKAADESWSKFVDFLGEQVKIQEENRKKFFDNSGQMRTEKTETEKLTDDENYKEEKTTTYDAQGNEQAEIQELNKIWEDAEQEVHLWKQEMEKLYNSGNGNTTYHKETNENHSAGDHEKTESKKYYNESGNLISESNNTKKLTDDENYKEEKTTTYDEEGNTETEITKKDDYKEGTTSTTVSDGDGNSYTIEVNPLPGVQIFNNNNGWPLTIGGPPSGYQGDGYQIQYNSPYSNNPAITLTNDENGGYVAFGGESFGINSNYGFAENDFDIYGNSQVDGNIGVGGNMNADGYIGSGDGAYVSGNAYFQDNTSIQGDLYVTGQKNFRIDHPDDPENKYLQHACIESDEVMNQYTGNVVTNSEGIAVVELAEYIQKINIDFRYQLTVIGDFAQAIIAKEVENNQFTIMTDKPNIKVSWMIIAKRNDKYMQEHPFEPVVLKNKEELNRVNNIFNKEKLNPNSDLRNKRINRNEK